MRHAHLPEPRVLFCPRCHCQHEDFGHWATRPHRTHRCLFCKHEWRPFPFTTVGVASPDGTLLVTRDVFFEMEDYSCTIPTDPRSGTFWRRREPYRILDDDPRARHFLGLAQAEPTDPPDTISLFWRSIVVAEWEAGRLLSRILETEVR